MVEPHNPLAEAPETAAERLAARAAPDGVVLAWSGWFGAPDTSDDGRVDPDHRTWAGEGRTRLDALLAAAVPRFTSLGARLWLRPHARHVLSDGPSCAAFVRAHAGARGTIALLLDLDLLLTPEMHQRRAEHTDRILQTAAAIPGIAAIALREADWNGPIGRAVEAVLEPEILHLEDSLE